MRFGHIVVVEIPALDGGVPMRVGHIVAAEDPAEALSAVITQPQEGEVKYVLGRIPGPALRALKLTRGMSMAVRQ
jgi:hypothetical protein